MVNVRAEPYVNLATVLHWIVNGDEGQSETVEADMPAFDDAAKDIRRVLLEGTVKALDPASGKEIAASEWFWDEHPGDGDAEPEEDIVLARAQDLHCQILRADLKHFARGGNQGPGRPPAEATGVWAEYGRRKTGFKFKRGEFTRVAKEIAVIVGLSPSAVEKIIRLTYKADKASQQRG